MKNSLMALAVICSVVLLSSCFDLSSDDTSRDINVTANSPSPNQAYIATSYGMSGGGAAGWCYVYLNVRKQNEQFNPDSNIIFQTRCNVEPQLVWKDERNLSIAYPRDATVYKQEKTWGNDASVRISYEPK
jgi:hypothetical protein